jgi:NarL family two-component system sensor histidine kinase YdfH
VGGVLITVYLLCLAFTNFILLVGVREAGWFAFGTIPTLIFVAIYVILFTRQAEANTRARELLAELEAANKQLSDYAAQVEDLTLATERQRMARELHDTLSQGLAGLILQLEAVDAHLASQRVERGRTILQQSMEKARGTLAEARQAIDNLRRPLEYDLVEMVRREAEHFSSSTGITCEPQIDLKLDVPEAVAEAAGKAVSEGLTNIARHAQAKIVTLRMSEESKGLEIKICDDGVGFDPEAVQAGHYGLVGMRERVRLAGGSLEVQSAPNKGTCVKISFPLDNGAQEAISGNAPQEFSLKGSAGSDHKS